MRRNDLRLQFYRGSHLPILMKVVGMTTGPILELGCGIYSTTYLHWACYATKRRLVTYENNPQYFEYLQNAACDYHEVKCLENWDAEDLSGPWSVAFVDPSPETIRVPMVRRVAHADYVVLHDVERGLNRRDRRREREWTGRVAEEFKYRFTLKDMLPWTALMSNTHDVTEFSLR